MSRISELLGQILAAVYGRDVRQSIHDAIEACYDDVTDGVTIAQDAAASATAAASDSESRTTAAIGTLTSSVNVAITNCNSAISDTNAAIATAMSAANKIESSLSSVAPIEPEAVATRDYAVDDYFYLSGLLYVVTQPIVVGDNLEEGVNCRQAMLFSELKKSTADDVSYIVGGSYENMVFVDDGEGNIIVERRTSQNGI